MFVQQGVCNWCCGKSIPPPPILCYTNPPHGNLRWKKVVRHHKSFTKSVTLVKNGVKSKMRKQLRLRYIISKKRRKLWGKQKLSVKFSLKKTCTVLLIRFKSDNLNSIRWCECLFDPLLGVKYPLPPRIPPYRTQFKITPRPFSKKN